MSSPANVNCPCGGDAFKSRKWEGATIGCYWCRRHYTSRGKCLGPDGWPLMALAAAEVARERDTGGTVTNVTLYPAGPDPRLVQDDWLGWDDR